MDPSRITDEHDEPGERTYRYLNGMKHAPGLLPPGTRLERRRTLPRMLWQVYKAWRASRRRTLDVAE